LTPRPHVAPHAPERNASAAGAIALALAMAVGLGIVLFRDHGPSSAKPAETTPKALLPLPRAGETVVALRALDDAWVRAAVDGTVVFAGRVPRGAVMDWKPARGVSLRTTAPSSIQITVNGAAKPLGSPTPDGEYRIDVP
ncbi:MAG: DUF4115 domain-containing protein, partial [Elusimicrobia bacterium]|nr:DUF4115 domain-containing protein [Elusimicrobiota bacterium]